MPADHPAGVGDGPLGQARAQRARWPARSAPTWSWCTRRSGGSATTPGASSRGSRELEDRTGHRLRGREHVPLARLPAGRWRSTCPGWDPSEQDYANATIDLSHSATARSDPVEMAQRLGDRLRHLHLTDGTGSAKDEHLVPGRGTQPVAGAAGAPGRPAASAVTSWCEINTRKAADREATRARPPGVARVRPAQLPPRPSRSETPRPPLAGPRGRRPGGPDTRGEILDAARESFARRGYVGTTIRAVASAAGRGSRAGAPLLRQQGRPVRGRAGDARSTRAGRDPPGASPTAWTMPVERLLRMFLRRCGTTPRPAPPAGGRDPRLARGRRTGGPAARRDAAAWSSGPSPRCSPATGPSTASASWPAS